MAPRERMRNAPWTCSGRTKSRRRSDSGDTGQKRKKDSKVMWSQKDESSHRTYLDNNPWWVLLCLLSFRGFSFVRVKVIQKSILVEQEEKTAKFGFGALCSESHVARKLLPGTGAVMMGHGSECAVYTFPFPLIVICMSRKCSSYGIIKGSIVRCQLDSNLFATYGF
jgi:hypothetical protein